MSFPCSILSITSRIRYPCFSCFHGPFAFRNGHLASSILFSCPLPPSLTHSQTKYKKCPPNRPKSAFPTSSPRQDLCQLRPSLPPPLPDCEATSLVSTLPHRTRYPCPYGAQRPSAYCSFKASVPAATMHVTSHTCIGLCSNQYNFFSKPSSPHIDPYSTLFRSPTAP